MIQMIIQNRTAFPRERRWKPRQVQVAGWIIWLGIGGGKQKKSPGVTQPILIQIFPDRDHPQANYLCRGIIDDRWQIHQKPRLQALVGVAAKHPIGAVSSRRAEQRFAVLDFEVVVRTGNVTLKELKHSGFIACDFCRLVGGTIVEGQKAGHEFAEMREKPRQKFFLIAKGYKREDFLAYS